MTALRRAVLIVAVLNGCYFIVEAITALAIGSVSLLADSADFLEDTAINLLVFLAATWSAGAQRRVGRVLAGVVLLPAIAALVSAVAKIMDPVPPAVTPLTITATGALVVNVVCALILVRHRHRPGSLAVGAWLAARNDALANVAIIIAGLISIPMRSAWPDIIVGLGICLLNLDAAREVWAAAGSDGKTESRGPQA